MELCQESLLKTSRRFESGPVTSRPGWAVVTAQKLSFELSKPVKNRAAISGKLMDKAARQNFCDQIAWSSHR